MKMMMTAQRLSALSCLLLLAACGSTGARELQYPAIGIGQDALPIEDDQFSLQITRAQLAYGPAYFCQTAAASPDLCPVAQAELLFVTTIDLLDPSEQPLGFVDSLPGVLGTTTYDLGWSWFPRDQQPRRAAGLEHSAEFEVTVVRKSDGATRTFSLPLDLQPTIAGTRTVGATQISATVLDDQWQLQVAADPRAWWEQVECAELFALPPEVTTIPSEARTAAILRQQITSGHPLAFAWVQTP